MEKLRPGLVRRGRQARARAQRLGKAANRRLRPLAILLLRLFSRGERAMLRGTAFAARAATRASAVVTPARAIAGVLLAASVCLLCAQFVDYRSVEIGQPGYAGLPSAAPPSLAAKTPIDAHSYLLVAVAVLAGAAALAAMRRERRGLGRVEVALGLVAIAVVLIVDLPAGLDHSAQSARFSGATAVLEGGFYAQLAAGAALVFGGLLYYARPCRIRINLSGRAASARRRRRRRRDSSPDRAARRRSPRRRGAESAPASPR